MRPCASPTLTIRSAEFGGARPLICVPLVATTTDALLQQATVAHTLAPEVIEWRADGFDDVSAAAMVEAAGRLRAALPDEALIFTLRAANEGGAKPLSPEYRREVIEAVVRAGHADIIDIELSSGAELIAPIAALAQAHGVRVILSFHDFTKTPANETLSAAIAAMVQHGADIAKIACMPRDPGDVLRLLDVTLAARRQFPALPLVTMSMGSLGVLTRAAGFLFGSDMSFAIGHTSSAPGQIPVADLRAMIDALLAHA